MSFYTEVIRHDPRFSSIKAINDPRLLEPGTRKAVLGFITEAKAEGHVLQIGETYRSQARQATLYHQGLTQLQTVGCHGFGVAVDLLLFGPKYDPVGEHYGFFQALAVKHGLVSGIGWGTPHAAHSFTDWDHLQRIPIFRQKALFAGLWYPPEDYDPYADMKQHNVGGM